VLTESRTAETSVACPPLAAPGLHSHQRDPQHEFICLLLRRHGEEEDWHHGHAGDVEVGGEVLGRQDRVAPDGTAGPYSPQQVTRRAKPANVPAGSLAVSGPAAWISPHQALFQPRVPISQLSVVGCVSPRVALSPN